MKNQETKEIALCKILGIIRDLREAKEYKVAYKSIVAALGIIEKNLTLFGPVLLKEVMS
jgi:hypothetical protein